MAYVPGNWNENRQHLNLSQYAYDIVEIDMFQYNKKTIPSMLNTIITCYAEIADATIDKALKTYEDSLKNQLERIPDSNCKQEIIERLIDERRKQLITIALSYPKGQTLKFRVNDTNKDAVTEWNEDNGTFEYYNGKRAAWFKAVIEEYARKTTYERENIIFSKLIGGLNECIHDHRLITVSTPNGKKREVFPYSIETDSELTYHYLVGWSREVGSNEEGKPASYRISKLEEHYKALRIGSGKMTDTQKLEIKRKLHDVGVQFILQEPETIRGRLSEKGIQMYSSQAHLRPLVTKQTRLEDGAAIYEFNCTRMQAEYYFFKFGGDAEILYPIDLRNRFSEQYRRALKSYEAEKENTIAK